MSQDPSSLHDSGRRSRLLRFLAVGCLLAVLIALVFPRKHRTPTAPSTSTDAPHQTAANPDTSARDRLFARLPNRRSSPESALTAEEIVAGKVVQFGKSRRQLVHALAKHFKVEVPDDVERFFDAVERGRWQEIDAAHNALLLGDGNLNQPRSAELHQIWRGIQETWGAAREAHTWPAQKLLDYGNAVLDSLRPGMVYVGGTDPGCFIPTLLNETSDGERHIVLTQNALADGTYLDYLNFLYGDRTRTLTKEDSQRAFDEYTADAQKRLEHDQRFPDEPKQIRPGENARVIDGKFQVTGQVAVMAINEKLFQTFMQNNPDVSFAMEESFPFKSTYANATTLGPVIELRVQDQQNALTAERAAQSVDYWRTAAQQLLSDPSTPDGSDPRKAYSKLVSSQAGLLLNRGYAAEAEQAFRIANEMCPTSPEAVFRYINLLMGQGRFQDAVEVGENAVKAAPENKQFENLLQGLKRSNTK